MAAVLSAAQLATAKELVGYLSPPLPLNTAVAVCGNVAQECQFVPTETGDGGVSRYWMQWQGARLTNYLAWCTENKLAPTSSQAIEFFTYELPMANGAPLIVSWLMDTSNGGQPSRSLKTLVADICKFYERAGIPDLDNRISYAEQVLASLPTPVSPTPPPPPSPPAPVFPPVPVPFPVTNPAFSTLAAMLTQIVSSGIFGPEATLLAQIILAFIAAESATSK